MAWANPHPTPSPLRAGSVLVRDGFCVDRDVHGVADDDTPPVDLVVPGHSEIMAIDLCLGQESGPQLRALVHLLAVDFLPPWRRPTPQVADSERHFMGHASDREITSDHKVMVSDDLHTIPLERDFRM